MSNVTLIITTYNRCHLLPRAVKSAQRAGKDVEIIVVDDASTDQTAAVCRSLQGIHYLRMERNSGLSAARNAGIQASKTDYVAFLDDDDLRLPDSIDQQVKLLDRNPDVGFVYGQMIEIDARLVSEALLDAPAQYEKNTLCAPAQCPEGDIFWQLLEFNFVSVPEIVARKRCIVAVGMFDPQLPRVEDWDLWLRLAAQYTVCAIKKPVAIVSLADWSSGQMTSDQATIWKIANQVQQRALLLPKAKLARWVERRQVRRRFLNRVSDLLIWHAASLLTKGVTRQARQCLLLALKLHPRRALRPWTFQLLRQSLLSQNSKLTA